MRRLPPAAPCALLAFAVNSILCRIALGHGTIDAASFATIRLAAGTAALMVLTRLMRREAAPVQGSWLSAGMLFLYAACFAFAYTHLSTGTGALILFGAVQLTMLIGAMHAGERLRLQQWIGSALAFGGLIYLVLPGLTAPSIEGAALMAFAGVSWGGYSLRGRQATHPLAQTRSNFARSLPFALALSVISLRRVHVEPAGVLLAVASGAVASGLGYVLWYAALRGLTASHAAVLQLSVPILAAIGGVLFLAETVTLRLAFAAFMVLGGLALALAQPPAPRFRATRVR